MTEVLPLEKYAPWSPSKASTAGRCALSFKYKYIDKVEQGPKSSVSKIGTTVHRAQELAFDPDYANVKVAGLLDQAIADVGDDLTHEEIERARTFAQSIMSFKNKIDDFAKKHPVEEMFLEQKWAINSNFEQCDFLDRNSMIRGVVDFGLLLKSGHLIIIDHKSGRLRPLNNYGVQLDVYAIMGQAYCPQVKGVQCAINFMAQDIISWNTPRKTSYVETVLRPWLVNYLNTKAKNVEGFAATTGPHCKWCDVRSACVEWSEDNGGDGESGVKQKE